MSGVFDLKLMEGVRAKVAEKKWKQAEEFAELVSGLDPESIFLAERLFGVNGSRLEINGKK